MKIRSIVAAALAAVAPVGLLQAADPGLPQANGLVPATETFYVNTVDTINNGNTESLGVAIARNGNVLIGWEDDGAGLADLGAVWTLYSPAGEALTQNTTITTIDPAFAGETLSSRFLAYFRTDGSAVSGRTSWGPKIKANLFGDGLGMGATSFDLGIEVVEFHDTQFDSSGINAGDFPSVQLLSDSGTAAKIISGVPAAYAQREGDIRVGDWHFLQNGNVVVVGESRQNQDLVDLFGGEAPGNHVIARIVDQNGAEVTAVQLVSDVPEVATMWHGVGATKNGFGVRFANAAGRGTVRLFDNAGTPITTNIDLATLAESEVMAAGGRGDGVGFHGNGNDAYAAVARGINPDSGNQEVWVTVLNADGSLRWAKWVSDDVELGATQDARSDVAIDAFGRVVVVYNDALATDPPTSLVLGRIFDANGNPLGGTFYVSEKEFASGEEGVRAIGPRVAIRGDSVAVVWESNFGGDAEYAVVGARFFAINAVGGLESTTLTRIVPDTVIFNDGTDNLANWEPYASVLGTSTFLVEANTFAEGTTDLQRFAVAFQPADGGNHGLGEGFFGDDGTPYRGQVNASRQDGNPGRIAGDRRPGAVNFIVGAEASPHAFTPFQTDNRWNLGFERQPEVRYSTIQTYRLDPATLAQTSLSKALDAINGRLTSGSVEDTGNLQITRFGGHIVALDNGNFAVVVEDRTRLRNTEGNAATAAIFAPDGSVVKDSFVVADGDLWANVAAFKGGFAVRVSGVIYFLDNAGNTIGSVDQEDSGITDRGRGDDTRLGGHINTPYVYLVGVVEDTVRLAVFDSRDQTFVAQTTVDVGGEDVAFARADVDGDALGRIALVYDQRPADWEKFQTVVRVYSFDSTAKALTSISPSFYPFINHAPTGVGTSIPTIAMTTRQILVAAKGEVNTDNEPDQGPNSPLQSTVYTVFSHPDPQDDPTPAVPGGEIAVTASVSGNNLVVTWTGGTAPFKVQQRASLSSGDWIDVTTTSDRTASVPMDGTAGFIQVVGQ